MSEMSYTSLVEVLKAAAVTEQPLISIRFAICRGRTTTVEYRNSFDISKIDSTPLDETDEVTAIVALLRQYGKAKGTGKAPYTLTFTLGGGVTAWTSAALVAWMQQRGVQRDTVPAELVEQLDAGTENVVAATVAGGERRSELEALKVEEVRKLAASLKLAGAWRTRKADLIEMILSAEVAAAS